MSPFLSEPVGQTDLQMGRLGVGAAQRGRGAWGSSAEERWCFGGLLHGFFKGYKWFKSEGKNIFWRIDIIFTDKRRFEGFPNKRFLKH